MSGQRAGFEQHSGQGTPTLATGAAALPPEGELFAPWGGPAALNGPPRLPLGRLRAATHSWAVPPHPAKSGNGRGDSHRRLPTAFRDGIVPQHMRIAATAGSP